jgi:ribosomal protein S17
LCCRGGKASGGDAANSAHVISQTMVVIVSCRPLSRFIHFALLFY